MARTPRNRVLVALCATAAVAGGAVTGIVQAAPRKAPSLAAPANDASVDAIPPFNWKGMRSAAKYEFQLSADPKFESIVLGQGRGSFQTRNTFATIDETLPNGNYYWRVRGINAVENAGKWSTTRRVRKNWNQAPQLIGPTEGETVDYPNTPLVFRWNPVPRAHKYRLSIGTDPTLSTLDKPIETQATVYGYNDVLPPGRYYWAITPVDARKHAGARSQIGSFVWRWPSQTQARVHDLNADPRVFDPQFSWDPVPGAAAYEVEINPSHDFAIGSKVCCTEKAIGTSLSPKKVLANNTYYWRMRALDLDGTAGQWNHGTPFKKSFDDVTPSIPNLHIRDHLTENPADPDPMTTQIDTLYPIVRWDPVPGASVYQVQVAPHTGAFCNWTAPSNQRWDSDTAATAWTPLANTWNSSRPGVESATVNIDAGKAGLQAGTSYCVRVMAKSDRDAKQNEVTSEWTQIGGVGNPAFKYAGPADTPLAAGPNFTMPNASAYSEPPSGVLTSRLPLFTWRPISGAGSYFIVVARDAAFTHVVDIALTHHPMYAPRKSTSAQTYPDETTSYYWAVVPAGGTNGSGAASHPIENSPRPFEKRSTPPTLLTPANGADINEQPMMRWTAAEGARDYQLQVASEPSFSQVIDDVTTAATSYTAEGTYPADTVLYWRVRANDENRVGLRWSDTGTFRRRLPVPAISPGNPTAVENISVLRWNPVPGATSYTFHVEEPDGDKLDFKMRTTAETPVGWSGTGTWYWQVRANFPGESFREVHGGYSPAQPITRHINTPANSRATNKHRRMLLQWDPVREAKHYRVEIATTDSFTTTVDRTTTDHTSWAPKLTAYQMIAGGLFYWRVAAVDADNNVGGWRVAKLRTSEGLMVTAVGFMRPKRTSLLRVQVRNGRRAGVRGARVVVSGARATRKAKRTNKAGDVLIKIRPRKRGTLTIRATKKKYRPGTAKLPVR